jgi:7-cyano-7-deazaguanine reductase
MTSYLQQSPLGKQSHYINTYHPSLLFPIPRHLAREAMGISDLPFNGVDIWTGYELSWLNSKGKPEIAMAEFAVPCQSSHLIESKSFKLYLNSFNQSSFDSLQVVESILRSDLSQATQTPVQVTLISSEQFQNQRIDTWDGTCLDTLDISVDTYDLEPAFLKTGPEWQTEKLYSHLLKSNCLATGQPDWGSVFIHYEGPQIEHEGLLKYLISFRNHQGFHEECVERMFADILHNCNPDKLTVYARYTRRGGLDINPFRSNFETAPSSRRLCRQ